MRATRYGFVVCVVLLALGCVACAGLAGGQANSTLTSQKDASGLTLQTTGKAAESTGKTVVDVGEGLSDPYYVPDTLGELETRSAAIVKVKMLAAKQYLEQGRQQPLTGPPLGYTLSTVLIENVYKSDGLIQQGDQKTIIEYYVTWQDKPSGNAVITSEGAIPMVVGEEYILFLHKTLDPGGDYNFFGVVYGKYRISDQIKGTTSLEALTKEQLEFPEDAKQNPRLWALAQDVKQKYISSAD